LECYKDILTEFILTDILTENVLTDQTDHILEENVLTDQTNHTTSSSVNVHKSKKLDVQWKTYAVVVI
jgi:hypothetical protein